MTLACKCIHVVNSATQMIFRFQWEGATSCLNFLVFSDALFDGNEFFHHQATNMWIKMVNVFSDFVIFLSHAERPDWLDRRVPISTQARCIACKTLAEV